MKRMARRGIEAAVPILGVAIILASVFFVPEINAQLHVTILLFGVLVLQAGPWGVTRAILPNERVSLDLRKEADHFLGLMRSLKRVADSGYDGGERGEVVRDTIEQMHTSVDRMAELTG